MGAPPKGDASERLTAAALLAHALFRHALHSQGAERGAPGSVAAAESWPQGAAAFAACAGGVYAACTGALWGLLYAWVACAAIETTVGLRWWWCAAVAPGPNADDDLQNKLD